mmetsp:Transcript_16150/g.31379  ORF Transcript_16150/g.31379 Transcript_16150/m.31379 type:complete len:267 (+) Transcript_16150:2241-3041(+)
MRTNSSQTCVLVYSSKQRGLPSLRPSPFELSCFSTSNCAFMAMRRNAKFACSAERSLGVCSRGSATSFTAACRASSRACNGSLEKTASNSQPPSCLPLRRPISERRPDNKFSAAPFRRSSPVGSSFPMDADAEQRPEPCSSTSMQWRPPRLPRTHCRSACLAASVMLPHSKSPVLTPSDAPPLPDGKAGVVLVRSMLGLKTSACRRPLDVALLCCCCCCCWLACCGCWGRSGRNQCSKTWSRPLGCTKPRPACCDDRLLLSSWTSL